MVSRDDQITALQDRVAELEALLGVSDDALFRFRALKLRPYECRILSFIEKQTGTARRQAIYTALFGNRPECDQPDIRLVDVYLCRIRRVLRPIGIEIVTVFNVGWALTATDKAKLNAWLEGENYD